MYAIIKTFLRSRILPLVEIDKYLPDNGTIVDLGCGEGTIATILAKKKSRSVIGIDKNSKRIPKLKDKNLLFLKADITKIKISSIKGAILSDVLHHVDINKQQKILLNVYKNLDTGGILLIKEIDLEEFLRSRLSKLWDTLLYPHEEVYFRKSSELKKQLKDLGFKVKIIRPLRLFPGSTTLFICTK